MSRSRGNTRLQQQRARQRNKLLVEEYKRTHPCIKCGEADPDKLSFHHRNPEEKRYNISDLKHQKNRAKLLYEMSKCDIWCIPCHREHHNKIDKEISNEQGDKGRVIQVGQSVAEDGRTIGNCLLGGTI